MAALIFSVHCSFIASAYQRDGVVTVHLNIVLQVPFESEHKFMATVHAPSRPGGKRVLLVKGAPDRVMPMCSGQLRGDAAAHMANPLVALDKGAWEHAQEELSSKGLRVLAICRWGGCGGLIERVFLFQPRLFKVFYTPVLYCLSRVVLPSHF